MSVLVELRDALAADAAVAALVGGRIYDRRLPPGAAVPAITLRTVSRKDVRSQDGPSRLARPRVQVDSWARTGVEVDELAEAVRLCLDDLTTTGEGGTIQGTFSDASRDVYDPDLKLDGFSSDFLVWHEE
jgi:Protein of unknown function (DUF3168)